jgi:hypothetical protein
VIADWWNKEASLGESGSISSAAGWRRFNRALAAARAYCDMVTAQTMPSATLIRAFLTRDGWTSEGEGPAGAIFTPPEGGPGIGVCADDSDPQLLMGAVERIARYYRTNVGSLVLKIRGRSSRCGTRGVRQPADSTTPPDRCA